ncbi:general secretion pathway protein GspL, partial [Vibrio xuii]
LGDYAEHRRTIVLLAAASLVLTEVEIPAGASRQFAGMLPFLLEDDLAQDVEQLHFSILDKSAGKAKICAVEKVWLEKSLLSLRDIVCQVQSVLPDVLALPEVEGIAAVALDDQWLL